MKCQLTKYPSHPIFVPRNKPNAPGATNTPGALARFGARFRLMLPPPIWKKQLPNPARQTTKIGENE